MPSNVFLSDDLILGVKTAAVRLTPSEGLKLAERLIRRSTARMMAEEAGLAASPGAAKRATPRGTA